MRPKLNGEARGAMSLSVPASQQSGPKILIIEDDAAIADVYVTMLAAAGYEASLAADARSGMRQIRLVRPDLVLLALNLPDISGTQVLKAIRADEALKTLPVIVLTASARVADVLEAVSAGADDCAIKPCEPAALLFKVSHLLSLGSARRQTR